MVSVSWGESKMLNAKVLVKVDGVEFETIVSAVGSDGFDLKNFGKNNEWADGKHYMGILKCLSEMFENESTSASVERKGSVYSVSVI